ncbi:Cytoplasmic and mitochondrial histidine tRNA synthetase [Rhizophlyctis rosea]|nr:Cytoplasmic and mitochondrial histidine tRNA synthetase [Rhizophlyctis rosea]
MSLDDEIAALTAQEQASRERNKEYKKKGDKEAEKKELEVLKDIMRKKSELVKQKKAAEKAAKEAGGSGTAAASVIADTPKEKNAAADAAVAGLKKSAEETKGGFTLKTAKGTTDYGAEDMAIREKIFSTVTRIFKKHGAITIDTPVFELKEILAGKYGEDSKLIYDLEDQGGEKCSLRYDLTVPFARYLAQNSILNLKRYHIAKVYRRDNPAMNRGRFREFYQCDFDIAGQYDPMIPDSEALRVMCEILESLDVGEFVIKINHRKILDGMFEVCGVPADKFRQISSAVDKLDKMPWEDVKKEMVEEKGLAADVADRIGEYVKLKGSSELCDTLAADAGLSKNASAMKGVEEMRLLLQYLDVFGVLPKVSFDLSLARGLDYYTGVIYEAVTLASPSVQNGEQVGVGSIAAGGRYDDLVGMFSGKTKIPCVGISIGVERIFTLLSSRLDKSTQKSSPTQVYVFGVGEGFLLERMKIANLLWNAGVNAEFAYKVKPKSQNQFESIDKDRVPLCVWVGRECRESGEVKVRRQVLVEDGEERETVVKVEGVVEEVNRRLEVLRGLGVSV